MKENLNIINLWPINLWIKSINTNVKNASEITNALHEVYESNNIHKIINSIRLVVAACDKCSATEIISQVNQLKNQAITILNVLSIMNDRHNQNPSDHLHDNQSLKLPFQRSGSNANLPRLIKENSHLFITEYGHKVDKESKTIIFDDALLEKMRVIMYNGRLARISIIGDHQNTKFINIRYLQAKNHLDYTGFDKGYDYVIYTDGSFFINDIQLNNDSDNRMHYHSSLGKNNPLFMAGKIEVESGYITFIDGASGHYKPSVYQQLRGLAALRRNGLLNNLRSYRVFFEDHWVVKQPNLQPAFNRESTTSILDKISKFKVAILSENFNQGSDLMPFREEFTKHTYMVTKDNFKALSEIESVGRLISLEFLSDNELNELIRTIKLVYGPDNDIESEVESFAAYKTDIKKDRLRKLLSGTDNLSDLTDNQSKDVYEILSPLYFLKKTFRGSHHGHLFFGRSRISETSTLTDIIINAQRTDKVTESKRALIRCRWINEDGSLTQSAPELFAELYRQLDKRPSGTILEDIKYKP